MVLDGINVILDFLEKMAMLLINMLPNSPFSGSEYKEGLDKFGGLMSNINYFVPFGTFLKIMGLYLVGVGIWYLARWMLRVVKYIN